MSRREKQRKSLALFERDFRSRLNTATIEAASDQHSTFFLAERFNPWPEMSGRTDSTTNQLVEDAERILKLRKDLGETNECLASIFLSFCESYCDTSDDNRNGVQKHATELLTILYEHTRDAIRKFDKRAQDGE